MKNLIHACCHLLFWGWNALFLMVVYLGIMPIVGLPLMAAIWAGEIPWPFLLPLGTLLTVPVACTLFGLVKLRPHPVLLMRLFYGVEAPLLTLALLRLFLLRELTPASTVVLTVGVIAIATVTLELAFGYAAYKKGLAYFQMVSHTLVLLSGLYIGSILLIYTVPLLCQLLYNFFQFHWLADLAWNLRTALTPTWSGNLWQSVQLFLAELLGMTIMLGALALFSLTAALFIAMPYALVNMFTRSWGRILQAFGRQYSWRQGWLITGGVTLALGIIVGIVLPQPQIQAFALLDSPPTEASLETLLAQSPQIRQGLLNAYLFPYRYLSPATESNRIRAWYQSLFQLPADPAQQIQNFHNRLLSPFLYQGNRGDSERAAALYAEFFDTPIQKAEKETIQYALTSTVNRDSVEASLLNINQRVIHLAAQEVTAQEQGDWATVEIYERYENFTRDDQEIVYQFSLPESATLSGIWLGEEGMDQRYRFVVSPRGAAQKVYKAEIERSQTQAAVDPALLEQVGPRQYRLRVFPIPPRQDRNQPGITHLWLTYQVMQQEGGWPLPQLRERRNLYWTGKTQRQRWEEPFRPKADIWYEAALPAHTPAPPAAHQVTLPEGYRVTATPRVDSPGTEVASVQGQRLAVVIDTSRSMGDRSAALSAALEQAQALVPQNQVDFYGTAAALPPKRLTSLPQAQALTFYGNLSLATMLEQWDRLRAGQAYDGVFVLTDAGNYELEPDAPTLPDLPGALYLVHLDGAFPPAYEDGLLQTLNGTGGGVAADLPEALARYSAEQGGDSTVMEGYRWQILSTVAQGALGELAGPEGVLLADSGIGASVPAPGPMAMAARQGIRWLSRSQDVTQVSVLDGLHAIAKRAEVVTPYSSMLVLVDDRQREALRQAEAGGDRFDRTVETGEDTLTTPGNPLNVPTVPETGMTLGISIGGVLCLWSLRRLRSPDR
ncbi:TIGR02921 family PEP-CTERM protein [Leptolyngbya sp. PCC 6406]|uniref:TIGR02921 family PEP-CTERM protein n=1 Tax=Leptolyngbya sp. PCC 6406 TaxID=1173264 RepID=UPI0002AC8CDC|nr:TIGR02921 family PEP-CTERM protein [Leptolyngbya sp. PCC 6406]